MSVVTVDIRGSGSCRPHSAANPHDEVVNRVVPATLGSSRQWGAPQQALGPSQIVHR